MVEDVARNLATIRAGIPPGVTLVAVAKGQPVEQVEAALKAGQRVFGENRVQEAEARWSRLRPRFPDVELHLIGRLQTNKAGLVVSLFDVIETIDRPGLAEAVRRAMAASGRRPACLVQVNTGREPQKGGVPPEQADAFIAECLNVHRLPVSGVMGIPPAGLNPDLHFQLLAQIAVRNHLPVVSMGMSSDFEQAIALGATHVRLGTAIFGPRPYNGR